MAEFYGQLVLGDFFKACTLIESVRTHRIERRVRHYSLKALFLGKFQKISIELLSHMMRFVLIFFIYEKLFQYGSIIAARHYSDSACKPAVVQSSSKVSACVYVCICDVQHIGLIVNSHERTCTVVLKMQHKINNVLSVFIVELSYFYHFIFRRNMSKRHNYIIL